jgi:hypothetical protein
MCRSQWLGDGKNSPADINIKSDIDIKADININRGHNKVDVVE